MKICYKSEEVKFEVKRKKVYLEKVNDDLKTIEKWPNNNWGCANSFADIKNELKINECEAEYFSINYIREIGADKLWSSEIGELYKTLFFDYISTDDVDRKKEIEAVIREFRFEFYKHYGLGWRYRRGDKEITLNPDNFKEYLTKKNN